MPSRYPSRQEIVDEMSTINVFDAIAPLVLWKDKNYTGQWKSKDTNQKIDCLIKLAYEMYYQVSDDSAGVLHVLKNNRYAFHPGRNVIFIDQNRVSILSTLHEIAHAICGESELKACAYSIKLFAQVFPNEYARLEWHGHMLRLKR